MKDEAYEEERPETPRWAHTPPKMKAAFPFRVKGADRISWECNSDPERLDRFYNNFLGRGGDQLLTDEVKWLAITHKSFDQGRRGFNDRLAFLGT
jgi:large subunit ribosomal protein L15